MPIEETKSFQVFRSYLEWLSTDIQVTDVVCRQVGNKLARQIRKHRVAADDSIATALHISSQKYDKLDSHPTKQARSLFNQTYNRRIEYGICQLYSYFVDYLHSILYEIYKHNPHGVVKILTNDKNSNSNFTMTYHDIIKMKSYAKIEQTIVDNVFRRLEDERSTPKLLKRILQCANIDNKINNALIEKAMPYLEIRHLFIHHNGKIDRKFADAYGNNFNPNLTIGKKVPRTFAIYSEASDSIYKLVKTIDKELIRNGMAALR